MAVLDNTQLLALKTDITTTNASAIYEGRTLLDYWNALENQPIAEYYNEDAAPADPVWRANFTMAQAIQGIDWSDFIGSGINEITTFANVLFSADGLLDMTQANNRAAFLEIFAGPQQATARRDILTRGTRNGTRGEILFTTATETTDTISAKISAIYGQAIAAQDVQEARGV